MQIVSLGDNLHEMSKPTLGENKKNINLSSAELAKGVVMVKRPSPDKTCLSVLNNVILFLKIKKKGKIFSLIFDS